MIRLSQPSADLVDLPTTRPLRRFSVAEYHRLIDAGVFRHDERFELLEGLIVVKMTRYPPHDGTISLVEEQLGLVLPRGWYCRIQSAVTTPDSEPEPDLAVVRGTRRSYLTRHPGAGDTALIVEVADASLADDRTLKARLYARAGFPVYWIVNLIDLQIEVYTDPLRSGRRSRYRGLQVYRTGDVVPVLVGGRTYGPVAVTDLLP
jgi:Uma2 family endonuclease